MSTVTCKQCNKTFPGDSHGESVEWDFHECEGFIDLPRLPNESFEDWTSRCEAAALARRQVCVDPSDARETGFVTEK